MDFEPHRWHSIEKHLWEIAPVQSVPAVPNPFIRVSGVSPPLLVGRDEGLDAFSETLEAVRERPGRGGVVHRRGRRGQDADAQTPWRIALASWDGG